MARFRDDTQYLWTIADLVLVECPRCRGQAQVVRQGPTFTCTRCGSGRRGQGGGYLGMAKAVVKRNCGWCGRLVARTDRRPGPHPAKIGVRCAGCSHWNYISATWLPDPQNDPFDPHFGYRLWLQTRCTGNVLWAYNNEHLVFLEQFVAAAIRERTPNFNGTLASRLPAWIKRAQDREALLRGIRRLQAMLLTA